MSDTVILAYGKSKPIFVSSDCGRDFDYRGADVYDEEGKCIGIVAEIYCSARELTAKYVEIIPFDKNDDSTFLYPFDRVTWHDDHTAILSVSYQSLRTFSEYDSHYVLRVEGGDLITYVEAIERGLGYLENNLKFQDCA